MTASTARTQIAHGKVHEKAELSLLWHFLVPISISKRPCIHMPTPSQALKQIPPTNHNPSDSLQQSNDWLSLLNLVPGSHMNQTCMSTSDIGKGWWLFLYPDLGR
jgi:hypothetical protein